LITKKTKKTKVGARLAEDAAGCDPRHNFFWTNASRKKKKKKKKWRIFCKVPSLIILLEVDDLDLLCDAITEKLNTREPEDIDEDLLLESLASYNQILEIDHESVVALKGKGYVLGLLDDFPQGNGEMIWVLRLMRFVAMEVLKQAKALAPNDTGIDDMIRQCSILEEEFVEENGI